MTAGEGAKYYTGYPGDLKVYRVDSKPFRSSYAEWFKKWWLWISSKPKSNHPMLDKTGKSLEKQQDKDVFYLASAANEFNTTYGGFTTPSSSKPIKFSRRCIVGKNKAILVPLLYSVHDVRSGDEGALIDDANECLAGTDLSLTVDGIPFDGKLGPSLTEFKITAGPFEAKYDKKSPFISDFRYGSSFKSVISGYLVLLGPLSAGEHIIHFIVNCKGNPSNKKENPEFFKNVKYTVEVKNMKKNR